MKELEIPGMVQDMTHITCGLVPKIQQMLARAGAGGIAVRVQPKSVEPITFALGEAEDWKLAVEPDGEAAVVRFTPRPGAGDDPLHRV